MPQRICAAQKREEYPQRLRLQQYSSALEKTASREAWRKQSIRKTRAATGKRTRFPTIHLEFEKFASLRAVERAKQTAQEFRELARPHTSGTESRPSCRKEAPRILP